MFWPSALQNFGGLLCAQTKCKASLFFSSNTHTQRYRHAHRPCSHGNGECWGSRSFQVFSSPGLSIVSATHPFRSHMHSDVCTDACTHNTLWWAYIVTIASERAKGLSGENMTLRGSIHIHKQSQVWIFNRDTIIHFCLCNCPDMREWKVWLLDTCHFLSSWLWLFTLHAQQSADLCTIV